MLAVRPNDLVGYHDAPHRQGRIETARKPEAYDGGDLACIERGKLSTEPRTVSAASDGDDPGSRRDAGFLRQPDDDERQRPLTQMPYATRR